MNCEYCTSKAVYVCNECPKKYQCLTCFGSLHEDEPTSHIDFTRICGSLIILPNNTNPGCKSEAKHHCTLCNQYFCKDCRCNHEDTIFLIKRMLCLECKSNASVHCIQCTEKNKFSTYYCNECFEIYHEGDVVPHQTKWDVFEEFKQVCSIYLDYIEEDKVLKLSCGHIFNKDNLKKSLKYYLENESKQPFCPECNKLLSNSEIKSIVDEEFIENLRLLILLTFYPNDYFRCLETKCKRILSVKDPFCKKCNKKYCKDCFDYSHDDKTCDQVVKEKNLELHKKENEELSILLGGTICPNCGIVIVKDGGCAKMTCNACNYSFCWVCKKYNSKNPQDVYDHMNKCK